MFWYFEMINNEEEYHRRVPIKDVREEGTRYLVPVKVQIYCVLSFLYGLVMIIVYSSQFVLKAILDVTLST
mgnify:FL=1